MLSNTKSVVLSDGNLFTSTVRLLCINENNITTQWSYREDSLSDPTDVTSNAIVSSNSISQLNASITAPGFYSCEVRKGGEMIVFSAGVFNLSSVTGKPNTLFCICLQSL